MLPIKRSDSSAPAKEDTADYLVEPVPLVPSSEASSVATTHVILPELHKMDSEFITPSFSSEEKPRSALRKRKSLHTSLDLPSYIEHLDEKINSGEVWEEIPSYDASQESRPVGKVPFFHPAFAEAEDLITQKVIQFILNAIHNLEMKKPSAELAYVKNRVENLVVPSYSPPVTIGIRGPAGKGRTSLINALLNVDELAHTSSGSVGTYVPVEFVPLGDQNASYGFEVRTVSSKESEEHIKTYWKDYWKCMLSENKEYMDDAESSDLVRNQALRRDLGDEKEQYERRQCLIEARNRQVKVVLRKWFRERTGLKDPLPVFCVSTTQYMELVRDKENRTLMDPPDFTAESTEIVALRQHVVTMVKKRGQDKSMDNYYRLVQLLLKEMTLACTNFKPMYKRGKLIKLVKTAQEGVSELCRKQLQGVSKLFAPILEQFKQSIDEWNLRAQKACDKWGNYNAASYWAFLRHHGKHKRPTKGPEDWNAALLEYATEGLETLIDAIHDEGCSSLEADLIQALHEKIDNLERELRLNLDQTHAKYNEFFGSMQLLDKVMESHVQAVVSKLQDDIFNLSHESFSHEARQNPFCIRMDEIYISVMDEHSPSSDKAGIHNSRRTAFKKAVTDKASGPYMAIENYIKVEANKMLVEAELQLRKGCDDVFFRIHHHVDQICPALEDDVVRATERGIELNKYLKEAKRVLEGPAKEALLPAGVKVT